MYVGAGPDEVSLDAYRLSGPLDKTERLTYSPVGLGINGLGANQHDVAIQRVCCGGLMYIEHFDLSRRVGLPGIAGPRVVIRSASGQNRSFLTNYWHPTCWLPNDTIFAVNLLKSTLGTLNPATGAITTIGHFPSSAALFVLDCPH